MAKYKIGDKVLVYGYVPVGVAGDSFSFHRGKPAKVTGLVDNNEIIIKIKGLWDSYEAEVHHKQCRKVKRVRKK